jgi:hypothetical protein
MTRSTAILYAKASWIAPLAAAAVGALTRFQNPPGNDDAFERGRVEGHLLGLLVFHVIGICAGIVALRATRQHGSAGIAGQAMTGLLVSSIFFLISVVALAVSFGKP